MAYEFVDDTPSGGRVEFVDEGLSEKQIADQKKKALKSFAKGQYPVLSTLADFFSGTARVPLKAAETIGIRKPDDIIDEKSLAYNVGSFFDPTALALGGAAFKGAEKAGQLLPMLSGPVRQGLLGGAAAGGGINLLTGDDVSTGIALGGLLGGGLSGAAQLVQKVSNLIPSASSTSRQLLERLGIDRNQAIKTAQNTKPLVPGEQPTAGSVAAEMDNDALAKLYLQISQAAPNATRFGQIERANEAARAANIAGFARTPQELTAAIEQRAKNAAANYGAVASDVVPEDKVLETLLRSQAGGSVESAARKSALDAQKAAEAARLMDPSKPAPIPFGTQRVEPVVVPDVVMGQRTIPGQPATYTVDALQKMKSALDAVAKEPAAKKEFGLEAFDDKVIKDIRGVLTTWLGEKSPGWAKSRDQFRADSAPINEMQVMQQLQKVLTDKLGREQAGRFATAMENIPKTIQTATGRQLFGSLDEAVSSQAASAARGTLESLSRQQKLEDLATGVQGLKTSNLAELAGSPLSQIRKSSSGFLTRPVTLMKKIVGAEEKGINDKMFADITEAMVSPQKFEAYLKSLDPSGQAKANWLADKIRSLMVPMTTGLLNQ
jgi:hypothetical protein